MKNQNTAEAPVEPNDVQPVEPSPDGTDVAVSEVGFPRMLSDRYRLERLIAKGGMGRVYLATQLPLERKVALKHLVRPTLNEDFRRRFFLEASVLSRLSHPNIVVVHDYGEGADGSLFMAMEYLDGVTLLDTLRREGRLLAKRAVEITIQVCRALRSAHEQGVAHRDLKPGNIMLLRDKEDMDGEVYRDIVKVLDFGLVKVFLEDKKKALEQDLTHAEMVLGSPRYMAPEQIQCEGVDARADVYSMGVLFFAMLTGRPPYVGSTIEILNQHLESEIPGINALTQRLKGFDAVDPNVEPPLNAIIQRCMQKKPSDRYQSMDEFLLELRSVYPMLLGDEAGALDLHPTPTPLPVTTTPDPLTAHQADGVEESHQRRRSDVEREGELAYEPVQPHSPGRRSLWLVVMVAVIVGVVTAGALVGGWLWGVTSESTAPSAAVLPAAPSRPADLPLPVDVLMTSTPAGARVFHKGRLIGRTPLHHELDRGSDSLEREFTFLLDGHQPSTVRTVFTGDAPSVHANLIVAVPEASQETAEPESSKSRSESSKSRSKSRRSKGRVRGLTEGQDGEEDAADPLEKRRERPNKLLIEEPQGTVPIVD